MRTGKMTAMLGGALLAASAMAAPSVEITAVQQQYPWTNTVDITYEVRGVTNMEYFVRFTPTTSDDDPILNTEGEASIQEALVSNGVFTAQWYPQTNLQYTACKMTPAIFRGGSGGGNDYMIVDLETWQVTYEPMATQEASNQKYNTAEYKTKKLVLRKIAAGPYEIGEEGTTGVIGSAPNPRHTVTASRDFYCAIYELTIAQNERIVNNNTSSNSTSPAGLDYSTVRGNALIAAKPAGKGLFAQLTSKSKVPGQFDLGTHAMWEIAARAGELGKFLTGDSSAGLTAYAWVSENSKINQTVGNPVGLLKPNNWGIYDMTGNKWECVLDGTNNGNWADIEKALGDALKPSTTQANTSNCIILSGGANYAADSVWSRLSMINTTNPKRGDWGIRVFYYTPQQ